MVLTLSMMSVMTFFTIITLLTVYSFLDIRTREVKNEIVLLGLIVGGIISLVTGHFLYYSVLHLTVIVLVVPMSFVLFKMGSIGGADVKILFTVALLSPGFELGDWSQPLLEVIIGLGGEMIVMLLGGYLYWRSQSKERSPPLIPMLLLGYLIVQLFGLF
jgi:Flp pilus assembly protein protease CpaA